MGALVCSRSTRLVNDVTKTRTGRRLSVSRKEIEKKYSEDKYSGGNTGGPDHKPQLYDSK